jgi:hypothetical protein
MATQTLSAIGSLKLGRAKSVPTKVTITNEVGNSVLLGPDAESSEEIVKYTGLNDVLVDGVTVLVTYTPIPNSAEVDDVEVSGIAEQAVTGSTISAFGTDGIMPVTAIVTAVV